MERMIEEMHKVLGALLVKQTEILVEILKAVRAHNLNDSG